MLFVVLREKESEYFVVYLSRFNPPFRLGVLPKRDIFCLFFFFFFETKTHQDKKVSLSLFVSLSLSLSRGRCNLFAQSALPPAAALARARGS